MADIFLSPDRDHRTYFPHEPFTEKFECSSVYGSEGLMITDECASDKALCFVLPFTGHRPNFVLGI